MLVFNKTVSLRDVKIKKLKQQQVFPQANNQIKPIEAIKKFGKKYMNLSEEKQANVKRAIIELSKEINYTDLAPLFLTAVKKRGTRAVVLICLAQLKKRKNPFTAEAKLFIQLALVDENQTLQSLASEVASK
jgi:glutaminyl-tRNA synthetase